MTLHAETVGAGRDLVLLHGWGMNNAVWDTLRDALAGSCRLTLVELPGHGASPAAVSADPVAWAAACLDVAPRRAHWMGWSLGGQLALHAALQAPERVTGLSLIATTPCFTETPGWDCAMPRSTFDEFADALIKNPDVTLMRFLSLQVKGDEHARATLKQLRAELQQRPAATEQGLRQGLELLSQIDLRVRLPAVTCPQYWLFGVRDTLVPYRVADWVRDRLPVARVASVAGAGHAPFLSHPRQFLDHLTEAIDDAA